MSVRILNGDCRDVLKTLAADSFDCAVSSPPYWGLRDYGCDGQIGLEPTLDAYVETMAQVAREVWRVLKPEGTFWLNLGDSYAGSWGAQSRGGPPSGSSTLKGNGHIGGGPKIKSLSSIQIDAHPKGTRTGSLDKYPGLKPKDLCGVPWRVAFALQARGWWLRSAIVWHKPNPMPESTKDRPTSAYEMVFLLTKGERYFYDADAIREDRTSSEDAKTFRGGCYVNGDIDNGTLGKRKVRGNKQALTAAASLGSSQRRMAGFNDRWDAAEAAGLLTGRNARNVWTIASQPFSGSHFATMPPELAERCILAGSPVGGHVLDPFGGAGTTGLVADRLGRNATLIELNPAYGAMAQDRVRGDAGMFADVGSA